MKAATRRLPARRLRLFGPANPLLYDDPLHLVRGEGVWLYDAQGRAYLDCYNNVPRVGHCHPRVVEAVSLQTARLNTHTLPARDHPRLRRAAAGPVRCVSGPPGADPHGQ